MTSERRNLPDTRPSMTHKAAVCGLELYVTVGFFDGPSVPAERSCDPAEVFCKVGKHGDVVSGLIDGLMLTISLGLQHGVPWESMSGKYLGTRFGTPDEAHTSLLDGMARMIDHAIEARRKTIGLDGSESGSSVQNEALRSRIPAK